MAAAGMFATTSFADDAEPPADGKKVWVCKFVQKPGENEVLKDGKNPIHVSHNATEFKEYKVGAEFKDGHERSVVVSLGEEDPGKEACEKLITPPEEETPPPTDEPEPTPTDEPQPTPTDKPAPPKDDDKGKDTPKPEQPKKDKPTVEKKADKPVKRGVPAKTGGAGDLGAIALIGGIGMAASGSVLAAARRKR